MYWWTDPVPDDSCNHTPPGGWNAQRFCVQCHQLLESTKWGHVCHNQECSLCLVFQMGRER